MSDPTSEPSSHPSSQPSSQPTEPHEPHPAAGPSAAPGYPPPPPSWGSGGYAAPSGPGSGYTPAPPPSGPPPSAPPPGGGTGWPGHAPDPFNDPSRAGKSFFGALFDFSFSTFVTPMIVKVVYVLATVLIALGYIGLLISSVRSGALAVIGVLILGAVGSVVYLAIIRISLEFMYAIVRMSNDIHDRLPRA